MRVPHGGVTVLVNRIRKKSGYVYYQIRYYADGVRTAKSYSDLAEAEKQAKEIAVKLHQGEGRKIELRGGECTAYLQAKAVLAPIPASLELAAREYRLAHDLLAGRASLIEAVRYFAEAMREVNVVVEAERISACFLFLNGQPGTLVFCRGQEQWLPEAGG